MRRSTFLLLLGLVWSAIGTSALNAQTMTQSFSGEPRLNTVGIDPAEARTITGWASFSDLIDRSTDFIRRKTSAVEQALRLARRDPPGFRARLDIYEGGIAAGTNSAADSAYAVAAVIILAGLSATDVYPPPGGVTTLSDDEKKKRAKNAAKLSTVAVATKPRPYIRVFAQGDLRGVASGESDGESTIGTGALGLQVKSGRLLALGALNVASSVDTIRSQFGQTMLNPATGRALQSGLLDVRYFLTKGQQFGIHAYFTASSSIWQVSPDSAGSVVVTGLGGTFFYNIASGKVSDTEIGFAVEGGASLRRVGGDYSDLSDTEREDVLGTSSQTFGGIEVGFQIQFGAISGAMQGYWYGGDVSGLSNGQITVGFQLNTAVLQGFLD